MVLKIYGYTKFVVMNHRKINEIIYTHIFNKKKQLYYMLLFFNLCSFAQNNQFQKEKKLEEFKVKINHPSINLGRTFDHVLIKNEENIFFFTEIGSVICKTHVCKIVPVLLFWNEIGNFTHYKLNENDFLEKTEGAHFTNEDYKKLDEILLRKESKLKGVNLNEIEGVDKDDEVDAISGATIVIDEEEIVKGAAWTCFTLWHWANGNISKRIREITAKRIELSGLIGFFKKEEQEYNEFVIEQLTIRKEYRDEIVEEIIKETLVKKRNIFKKVVSFLEDVPEEQKYYKAITSLLKVENKEKRNIIYASIKNTLYKGPISFYRNLILQIEKEKRTQEIQYILEIFKKNKIEDEKTINLLFPLLNEKLVISRKVFGF